MYDWGFKAIIAFARSRTFTLSLPVQACSVPIVPFTKDKLSKQWNYLVLGAQ